MQSRSCYAGLASGMLLLGQAPSAGVLKLGENPLSCRPGDGARLRREAREEARRAARPRKHTARPKRPPRRDFHPLRPHTHFTHTIQNEGAKNQGPHANKLSRGAHRPPPRRWRPRLWPRSRGLPPRSPSSELSWAKAKASQRENLKAALCSVLCTLSHIAKNVPT